MTCPLQSPHCSNNSLGDERQNRIDASITKQLRASMERNARMVNRLRNLQKRIQLQPVNFATFDIDPIIRDEDPIWPAP